MLSFVYSLRQHFLLMLDPGWTSYVIHPGILFYVGSSNKRKYCRNDQTNENSSLNICDVNSTIQVRRALWSGFYHTGSLLKQHKNELYFVRWLNNFRHYKVFDRRNTRMYDVRCPPCLQHVRKDSQALMAIANFGYPVYALWFYCFQSFKFFGFPIVRF